MSGFFTSSEISRKAQIKIDPDQLKPECLKCQLYKQCNSPKIKVSGEGRKEILIISEFPTHDDDHYNTTLIGDEGKIVQDALREINVSLNRDCWKIHAVSCMPPDRTPSHKEIKCCYPNVERTIRKLKPKLILLLGNIAITSLFGEDFSNRTIDRWRAYEIPDEKFNCYVMCLYAPWQLLRNEKDKNLQSVFKRDIKRVSHCLKVSYEKQKNCEEYVTILRDFKAVKNVLKRILRRKQKIAFDYETTGLKPFREGHKIASIGIAVSTKKAFAFPYEYKSYWTETEFNSIKKLWHQILIDKEIKKIAHNAKYEDNWSAVMFGTRPRSWHWDTMLAEKIIDNRRASTGLKFQTFVNYGIRPYDKTISPYLKSKDGEFNTVFKASFKELLVYNGLDCIYTMMRYRDQRSYLPHMKKMFKAYKFFMRGAQTMSTIQLNGTQIDMKYFKKTKISLIKRIDKIKEYLTSGREAKKFKQKFLRDIKITSNQDLGKLFYEVLGKTPVLTAAGNYKTDKATLEKLNLPFVDKLSEMKRLEKAKGTYLAQFARESYKGKVHAFFDLHIPVSYRGSSSRPNLQNIPVRDPEIGNLVRKGIVPRSNSVLSEVDFSGAEIITSACVPGDTKIETIEGSKTIKQIIKRIKKHKVYVFGYSLKEKRIKIVPVTAGGITGKNKEVWKVTLDNGKTIKATPNHKFMIRYGSKHEGKYVELKDLLPGMSLMPFYRKKKGNYHYVNLNNRKSIGIHTLIGIDIFKKDVGGSYYSDVIHHKKGFSNKISNLKFMTRKDHTSLHHKGKTPGPLSEEHKKKIGDAIRGIPCPQRGHFQSKERRKQNAEWSRKHHKISDEGRKRISKAKKEYWKNKEKVKCKVCGKLFRSITNTHLLNSHNMTLNEYAEYNHKVVSIEFDGYENVYNINVEEVHNYATKAGAIIKNCYHQDPTFIHDITKGDMHRDLAIELFMLNFDLMNKHNPEYNKEQIKKIKMIRFFAKNMWTFAQFYGDWFGSCAPNLWENVVEAGLELPTGQTVKSWLEAKGIYELGEIIDGRPTEGSFMEHCKKVETEMWEERFPLYTQWKKDIVEFYQKYGFIETHFGFRFQGYMDRKQCTNYPVQGTSFHLLVYTLIKIEQFIKKNNLKTRIFGQVHDSILADIPKNEIKIYIEGVAKIVSNLQRRFKWLTIPMEIEIELSRLKEYNGNFSDMQEFTLEDIKKEKYLKYISTN